MNLPLLQANQAGQGVQKRGLAGAVRPGEFPAKVIVAPSSPSARAHASAEPLVMPGATMGTTTVLKVRQGEAPSVAANRHIGGPVPASTPRRQARRRGGRRDPRNGEDSADSRGQSRTGDQPSSGVIVGRLAEMVSPDD